jgi:hypothetical protein
MGAKNIVGKDWILNRLHEWKGTEMQKTKDRTATNITNRSFKLNQFPKISKFERIC